MIFSDTITFHMTGTGVVSSYWEHWASLIEVCVLHLFAVGTCFTTLRRDAYM